MIAPPIARNSLQPEGFDPNGNQVQSAKKFNGQAFNLAPSSEPSTEPYIPGKVDAGHLHPPLIFWSLPLISRPAKCRPVLANAPTSCCYSVPQAAIGEHWASALITRPGDYRRGGAGIEVERAHNQWLP